MGLLQTKQLRGYNTSKSRRGRNTEEAAVVVSIGLWIKGNALLIETCSPLLQSSKTVLLLLNGRFLMLISVQTLDWYFKKG